MDTLPEVIRQQNSPGNRVNLTNIDPTVMQNYSTVEVVVKFRCIEIQNNEFYTDSNGLKMIKRNLIIKEKKGKI